MAWVREPNNIVPIMTSNTTPRGVAFASSEGAANVAAAAYNNNLGTAWYPKQSPLTPPPWKLGYEFVEPARIYGYTILSWILVGWAPKNWTFEGWTGTAWKVLHTRTNITAWSTTTPNRYLFTNTEKYLKYQLNVTASNTTNTLWICKLEMLGDPLPEPTANLLIPQAIGCF
ncbi:hypothetical protein [Pelosinus fermentans]|uniref:Coagulation factor 5/8 type domain protein n=1 Tax=Pelosinus fermentans JBW45 TaxID=1192197 RepID=I8TQP1_9FIRM|nr:hypothetical protein [Pelosinus fermentans]AJQ26932.1 hypothetical protein JBW_01582 [Pelosinus fermentans JBW45]